MSRLAPMINDDVYSVGALCTGGELLQMEYLLAWVYDNIRALQTNSTA